MAGMLISWWLSLCRITGFSQLPTRGLLTVLGGFILCLRYCTKNRTHFFITFLFYKQIRRVQLKLYFLLFSFFMFIFNLNSLILFSLALPRTSATAISTPTWPPTWGQPGGYYREHNSFDFLFCKSKVHFFQFSTCLTLRRQWQETGW